MVGNHTKNKFGVKDVKTAFPTPVPMLFCLAFKKHPQSINLKLQGNAFVVIKQS